MPDDRPDGRLGSAQCADTPLPASLPPGTCWPSDVQCTADPHVARLAVTAGATATRSARDFTQKYLLDRGLRHLVDDAAMVVDELLVNALTHARPTGAQPVPGLAEAGQRWSGTSVRESIQVILIHRRHRVTIVVTDPADTPPSPEPHPDLFAESGRGLQIVQALSSQWGWAPLPTGGKAVWALIDAQLEP